MDNFFSSSKLPAYREHNQNGGKHGLAQAEEAALSVSQMWGLSARLKCFKGNLTIGVMVFLLRLGNILQLVLNFLPDDYLLLRR